MHVARARRVAQLKSRLRVGGTDLRHPHGVRGERLKTTAPRTRRGAVTVNEQCACQRLEQRMSLREQAADTIMSFDTQPQPVDVPQSRHV